MSTLVHFQDVGRDKRSWKQVFPQVTEAALARAAKKGGGLMSSNIDCLISDNGTTGLVLVGGWRPVGSFFIGSNAQVPQEASA